MTIQVEHRLPKEEAKRKIEELIDQTREEHKDEIQSLVVEWSGDSAHIRIQAKGYSTAGTMDVKDKEVDLDFHVPFMLQVFSKKIKAVIQDRIQQTLV